MIYTVTFNPSLDYIVSVKNFTTGVTNRTESEQMFPGGKGINVSLVLKNLGIDNTAIGFTGGFVGDEIKRLLDEIKINSDFIDVPNGNSRINIKLKSIDGTEINAAGPTILKSQIDELMKKLDTLSEKDILVLAGSIPASMPDDMYEQIMSRLDNKGVRILVDATGSLLTNVLKYHPFLIKPNNHELGDIFGVNIKDVDDIISYARKLQIMGAQNVLVSMAGDGAVLISGEGKVYRAPAPKGKLINAVGAGDSMLAGFLTGWLESGKYEHAFRMGVAAGSASAFSENLAKEDEIREFYKSVIIANA